MQGSFTEKGFPKWPLQILLVEDEKDDVKLCLRALLKAKLEFHCDPVSTAEQFMAKLSEQNYDAILADYQLQGWTGMDALTLLRDRSKDIPFILVTGALGEETAVACLKRGVDDYVLKHNLALLPEAIGRALERKNARETRSRADAALQESEERFRTLAEAMASPILIYQGTECRYANRAAQEITGYTLEELMAASSWEIVHPDSRDLLIEQGLARLQGTDSGSKFELKILTKQGHAKWLEVTLGRIQLGGKPAGIFTGFDITERKATEEKVLRMAASDPLTGLANYGRLIEAFGAEIKRSQRTGRIFAILLLDLDGLKQINDLHGHLTGSRALCRVANTLRGQCRSMDIPARHGGDEFAVLLPETGTEGALRLGRRICGQLSHDGQEPSLSISVGAAEYPQDGQTYEEVFAMADHVLYEMKGRGAKERGDRQLQQRA